MSLDYLLGHKIDAISQPLKSKEWNWALILDSGARVVITDGTPKPESAGVVNTTLGMVYFGGATHRLDLFSGEPAVKTNEIALNRGGYRIEWPKGMTPVEQDRDVEADRPADPSPERVAEGPETE